jgi:hypothetical protein
VCGEHTHLVGPRVKVRGYVAYMLCRRYCRVLLGQGWAKYGPRAKYGPLRGSMRPAEGLENAKKNEVSKKHLRIMSMFASSYLCEQVFSSMTLRKSSVRNRLTDGHLAYLLRVTASQLEPEYEKLLDTQSQFHLSHTQLYKGTKIIWKHQVCRNQGKLKYVIIIFSLFHYYYFS